MSGRFPVALLATILAAGAIGCGLSHTNPPARETPHPARASRATSRLPSGSSYVARARDPRLPVYTRPDGRHVRRTLRNPTGFGSPLTLLVRHVRGPWIEVLLPTRPGGAEGWIPRRSVRLLSTAYALHADLRNHRLRLLIAGHLARTFPIAVGRALTPTPKGRYFITDLLQQPDPSGPYGPYAFGLSAYSGTLRHFGHGGNGQIGIHGTNQPTSVGTDVSHGCIRLRNTDITWLAHRLPLGTPVIIQSR